MNDRHIIDDPERASGYVLGKLSPAERERIDTHVGECPDCRALLEKELRVAAAARRLGRDGMKARLRGRVARPQRAARILAVAATIASLVGIGVVTRHFLVEQEVQQEQPSMTDRSVPPQEQQALRTAPPTAGGAADMKAVDKLRQRSREDTREIPRDRDETAASNVAAPAASVQERAGKAEAAPIQDMEVAGKVAGKVTTGESYWTDGIASPPPEREERMVSAAAKEKKDIAGKGAGNAAEAPQFVLTQRRAAELPPLQQNRQILRNSVPTLFEQRGSQTLMTLYLDSLVDQNELSRARVEQPGADSLVIRMQNQSIQYQLPVNRTRQQVR
jgi:hypothetical protein